jgi:hypothetical protein
VVTPVRRGPSCGGDHPFEVHIDHDVPLLFGQIGDVAVADYPGVVDQDVQVAVGVERRLDDVGPALPGGHVVVAGHGLPAASHDLGHDPVRGAPVGPAGAVRLPA